MTRPKAVASGFLVLLAMLFVEGTFAAVAYAQNTGTLPSQVVLGTPMGQSVIDLGNLTMPAALVLVAWMYRDKTPIKMSPEVHIHHHHPEPDE